MTTKVLTIFTWLMLAFTVGVLVGHAQSAAAQPVSYQVFIAPPDDAPRTLDCTEDLRGIPGEPDVDQVNANGLWFIGLDVGAHQAAHKLVCSEAGQ